MMLGKLARGLCCIVVPVGLFSVTCIPAVEDEVSAGAAGGALGGKCRPAPQSELDCSAPRYDINNPDDYVDAGLEGFLCSGGARPDSGGTYVDGVPRGRLCAKQLPPDAFIRGDGGAAGADGKDQEVGYCCAPETVDCVYDPVSDCEEPSDGYQCWSTNRPESLNPAISCSNGNREGKNKEYVNYCCTGLGVQPACSQVDVAGCSEQMLGFQCWGDGVPRGENLGPNKSRADFFHPLCTRPPIQPGNKELTFFCCYMPALPPVGGTCVGHLNVPGCASGRFGIACYGPDDPEDNFLPMVCDPGVQGLSDEGYPATLYCCDYT